MAVALHVTSYLQTGVLVNLSGLQKEDKVFDAVIEEIRFGTKPAALVTKRKVKAIAYLSPEVLIADLKRNCVVVRSVVIKFFQIRQAAGMRIVGDKRAII